MGQVINEIQYSAEQVVQNVARFQMKSYARVHALVYIIMHLNLPQEAILLGRAHQGSFRRLTNMFYPNMTHPDLNNIYDIIERRRRQRDDGLRCVPKHK